MMNKRTSVGCLLICTSLAVSVRAEDGASTMVFRVFDGKPKTIVVNGYSTSFHWPKILQRKLDRYFDGKQLLAVRSATKGGTPIAKWINAQTGEPLAPWVERLRPALKGDGGKPVVVLAQQSLQWAFGDRAAGIRNEQDSQRIQLGAQVIERFANQILRDGADEVFIAMHIYKKPMEPEIGNERLALAAFLKSRPGHIHAGPDVWEPTKNLWPGAFAPDRIHPNLIGAEVMAQKWFETLLAHDGLEAPQWSRAEMDESIRRINESDKPTDTGANRGARRPPPQVLRRYDKDGDCSLSTLL